MHGICELEMAKSYFIILILALICFLPASMVTGLEYPLNESEKERSALTSIVTCTLTSINQL